MIESCRAGNLLSNDIKWVMMGYILTELHIPEHTTVGTHRNRKMPNYLLFIDILGRNPLTMIITRKMVKKIFLLIFSDPEIAFSLCLAC